LLAISCAAGCGSEEPLTTVSFRLVGPPAALAGQGCPEAVEPTSPVFPGATPSVVRLTYRYANQGDLVCDVVLALSGGNPVIALPGADPPAGPIDIYAEYFEDNGGAYRLVGTGRHLNADLTSPGPFDVRVTPRDQFSCAAGRAGTGRVFHAAVALPSGEILISGGAVADPSGSSDRVQTGAQGVLYATSSIEMYDPETGTSEEIAVPGLVPRLMHQAYVLADDGSGTVRIALYGGFTVTGDPAMTPALAQGSTFRLDPTPEAVGAPIEILHYDPSTATLSRATGPSAGGTADVMGAVMSGPQIAGGATPVTAGGWLDGTAASDRLTFDTFDPSTAGARGSGALRHPRMGATLTDIDGTSALLWGGGLQPIMDVSLQAGELLVALGGSAPSSSALTLNGSTPAQRAWHAAARAGDGSVLVAGGFLITGGAAVTPQPVFVQQLVVGATTTIADVAVTGGAATPVGYPASITLADGSVLISGGNPGLGVGGCSMDAGGLVCSVDNAYRFRTTSSQLEQAAPLAVSRYGHRMTRLPDGTVLISGGLHGSDNTLRVLADNEIFDPRTELDDPISDLAPAIQRSPGDIARDSGGNPAAECVIIETREPSQ
jgi:hypothetical protein